MLEKKTVFLFFVFCFHSLLFGVKNESSYPANALLGDEILRGDSTKTIFPISGYEIKSYQDVDKRSPMDAPNPSNLKTIIDYNPILDLYLLRNLVGDTEISTPYSMNEQEYYDYAAKKAMSRYWKEKSEELKKSNEEKFSLTDMKFDIGPADKIFGPGGVQVKTQGSAEILFGIRHSHLNNPSVSPRLRRNTSPNFEQKIQLNVNAKVGTSVDFNLNYNTEASFSFDQKLMKLAYRGQEDDIIKNIEVGNVSMQLNSSLIGGSSALFGIKTDLQFGKLKVSAIASQQQSESQTVNTKGGVQTSEFEVNIDDYDANRHFFIAHYFRDGFEKSMSKLPFIASGITINRVEVWKTNKRGRYEQARNVLAFTDLAEKKKFQNTYWSLPTGPEQPSNKSNKLYDELKNISGLRDIQESNQMLDGLYAGYGIHGGEDYEKIESALRLDPSEYTLNAQLGILSLQTALYPDEVLGIAFEYTYNGQVYQVGEFSTDNIKAPDALFVKMIKGTMLSPGMANWDLMLKNVYYLGAMQLQEEHFKLDIVYRNDSIGSSLQYIDEGNIKNQILLRVMNLDRLNQRQQQAPDGKFDYVDNYTVFSSTGRIMFPVLEPFGKHLKKMIGNDAIAQKYVYEELYDSTLVVAREYSEKNKFRIVGEYKASKGNEIRLNAMNVPQGSVTVTAGGEVLVENVDYSVDYMMGTVSILRQSLLESGTHIDIKLENQSMFNLQRKTLLGTHLEYEFNKNFTVGGTVMHLSETPLTTKVNSGSEPISNTIWGLNTSWRGESQWLTDMVDKLPFVNASKPSSMAVNAEFAHLIAGHSNVIGTTGLAYIDDFEATKTNIDVHHPFYWKLASTPSTFNESIKSNDVEYGKNRALLAWYYVDPILNENTRNTPLHLRNNPDLQSNHLTRNVSLSEIYPNREILSTQTTNLTVLNLSFYPKERGPYNLNYQDIQPDGLLNKPEERWGGIMRKIDQTDFESSNIEYIEFWMMDPFVNDNTGAHQGGDLYFNLGDISEDVLKDGKKFFENGLNINGDLSQNESTVWGYVPRGQSTVNAFDNTPGARKHQDLGLNGLSSEQEKGYGKYKEYIEQLEHIISEPAKSRLKNDPFSAFNDPAGDNYHYYRGSDYDAQELSILERYKRFNGTEGNSPENEGSNETYATNATRLPDNEDINNDNTMNEYEKYFQYKISIRRADMNLGNNYITEVVDAKVKLKNGKEETVRWYQFKLPVSEYDQKVGSIRNFKSIRFMRMFMTNFQEEMHLRFATLDFVRGDWRSYTKMLHQPDELPQTNANMDVFSVNIEENGNKKPLNYVLPPGVSRQTTPGQIQMIPQNEQAMVLRVSDLAPKDARAVYKKLSYDMRQYKRLQMFVHAEKLTDDPSNLDDQELSCFIRLGSDMTNNYYEYEVPLNLTPAGNYSNINEGDRARVWPKENMLDVVLKALTDAKLKRNAAKQNPGSNINNYTRYEVYDPKKPQNKITVLGNPSLAEVSNIMIGLRNNSSGVKSAEVWVNELRLAEFDESGGWAAMGNMALSLSDIGSLNLSARRETAGFGSVESNVQGRRMDDLKQMNLSTSVDAGRFLPEQAKLQVPIYFSYTNEVLEPKYNPLDQDVLFSDAVDNLSTKAEKDSLIEMSVVRNTTRSFNIANARINIKSKKPKIYDPANLSFTYAYSETSRQSAEIERDLVKDQKLDINYSFSFNSQPFEPFKNVRAFQKPIFKLFKEINFYYLPTNLSFNSNMSRQFSQVKLRELSGGTAFDLPENQNFSKDFMWSKQFNLGYRLTRNINLSLTAASNAHILETRFTPEIGKEHYEAWRDTVWSSIRHFGEPYTYQQTFNASWNLPMNEIPFLDWINATANYNSSYSWNKVEMLNLGNIVASQASMQLNAQFNMEQLYRKSRYLQGVEDRSKQQQGVVKRDTPSYSKTFSLKKGEKKRIYHNLNNKKINVKAQDDQQNDILAASKVIDGNSIEISLQSDADDVLVTIFPQRRNDENSLQKITDFTVRSLMLLRRFSVSYNQTKGLTLPGFLSEPGFAGQRRDENGLFSPGYGFSFGFFDQNSIAKMKNNGWLIGDNDTVVNPAIFAHSSDLDIKASLEPIPGLKIELDAKQIKQGNRTTQYMTEGMPVVFTGNYNITQIGILTAFKGMGSSENGYSSQTYDRFLANRKIIAQRLNAKHANTRYPDDGFLKGSGYGEFDTDNGAYSENSADVLIPAFLAAYSGRDASTIDTSPLISLLNILPNWRLTYDGLSKLSFLKKHFQNLSLTHAYVCRYTINSYSSYSTWVPMSKNSEYGYVRSVENDKPMPSLQYDIPSVSFVEQFSPLVGVNLTFKNGLTTKFEYKTGRNLSLNLASTQLIDMANKEYLIGFNYTIKDFDLILRLKSNSQTKVKNDLRLNVDVSYKDDKILLRKIDEGMTQASSGNKSFAIKMMADYVFSSKINLQVFFDHQSNTPLVSSSFPVSTTNFGLGIKFMLAR